jgi:hypothetical protein
MESANPVRERMKLAEAWDANRPAPTANKMRDESLTE